MKELEYVFEYSVLSCSNNGEWVKRSIFTFPNRGKRGPWQLAGDIAGQQMNPSEQGVRVEFLGLREVNGSVEITPNSPFTVVLYRNGAKFNH